MLNGLPTPAYTSRRTVSKIVLAMLLADKAAHERPATLLCNPSYKGIPIALVQGRASTGPTTCRNMSKHMPVELFMAKITREEVSLATCVCDPSHKEIPSTRAHR